MIGVRKKDKKKGVLKKGQKPFHSPRSPWPLSPRSSHRQKPGRQKDVELVEDKAMCDPIHRLISVPPK
ncbi:MAG: hypothetical protein NTU53_08710 [Planctomycetota bacterium]|nr:hypothetical protein [Planctomycetota bacterium]